MNFKQILLKTVLFTIVCSVVLPGKISAQSYKKSQSPFLGWNSYDCYGTHINEKLTNENLDVFIQKLKPSGFEYFVLDAGWFRHYDLKPGEIWPSKEDSLIKME
jgi:alpha-galactosidase